MTAFKPINTYQLPMHSEYVPAWVEMLRRAGYPPIVVVLDFETYFETGELGYSMHNLTTYEYIADKRFEVLCLSRLTMAADQPFANYEGNTHCEVGEERVERYLRYLQTIYGPDLAGCTVLMQNAPFDANVLGMRYGIYPRFVIDTYALARSWHSRSNNDLEALCKRHGLPEKGETKDFAFVTFRKRMFIPKSRKRGPKMPQQRPIATTEQVSKLAEYANNDVMREWEVFTILMPKLVNPGFELKVAQHTLELATKPTLRLDIEGAEALAAQMEAKVDEVCALAGHTVEEISGNLTFDALMTTALEQAGEIPMKWFKPTKNDGFKLAEAKDDPERIKLLTHENERVRVLMKARTELKSWPLHAKRVLRMARIARACNGAMPVPLKYCGAHTGRWSGGEKINLQNLPRQGDLLVVAMKGLILAAIGYKLVIADAAAIEARVLAWIAGQWDLVELFKQNADVYCDMASAMAGKKIRKARKDDIPAVADRYTVWRQRGKIVILGSGYGMGPDALIAYAVPQGVQMTLAEATEYIKLYREKNKEIVAFWRAIEKAFLYTAKYKRPCAIARGISFHAQADCDVVLTLPNGREIKYHKVKITPGKYNDQASVYNAMEHRWEYLWGGVLTENVVQAMSRDILIEAGMRCEGRGHHVAHHIHDELVGHEPEETAEKALPVFIKELSVEPVWAPGLALNAEGVISDRYGKH